MTAIVFLVVGGDMYGLSRTALDVASGMQGESEIEFWSATTGPLLEAAADLGIKVRTVPMPILRRGEWTRWAWPYTAARLLRDSARLWSFSRALRKRVSVVHAFGSPNIAGLVVSRATGAPLVWSVHEAFHSRLEARVFGLLLRGAQQIIACSRFVADQFGGAASIAVIHSGTDVSYSGRLRPPLSQPDVTITCVGRLNRWKGQDVLVKAVADLPVHQRQRVTLQLVGSAFDTERGIEQELVDLANQLGIRERVLMLGQRDDAVRLMAESDIVVVPSQRPEPFGKVVIEALAVGRALVATRPGGPSEVITDGEDGFLVPIGSPQALTEALSTLINDPALAQRLGSAGRATASRFGGREATHAYRQLLLGAAR